MYRKELISLLEDTKMGLVEIARLLDAAPRNVEDDLRHLQKSLRHSEYRLLVTPARCRKCGVEFHKDMLHKPGKCPRCHETWIQEPLLTIERHP